MAKACKNQQFPNRDSLGLTTILAFDCMIWTYSIKLLIEIEKRYQEPKRDRYQISLHKAF